uniref:Helicase SRCAP n=1 Tax=Leptobrachium leishanense TaxID=445787 RepID=A0A8C5Q3Q0_9ANUR
MEELSELAKEGSSEYGSSDSEGVEYLLKPKDESETPQHSEPKKEITDIAATAESLQPKGYTLATTQVKTTVPFLLRGELREYQHIGLEWMVTMYEKKLNGILADEMGLGKTIQTISLLAHLACDKEDWGPHLIIVPTSVILNWEMELKRWCPSFKILTYYGSQKERRLKRQGWTKVNAFHVCITSYKLVLQDHQAFRRKNWKYLILDEAQNIKNFKSQRWQSLLNFNSQRRLLLTGTPLQNSLMELWSLMHFLMPHVFQSHREFKEWFSNPLTGMIEGSQEYNEGLVRRLHKVLRPFLLRRIKADVEKQMPKKYEHVIYCRLSKRQRFLYDDFMSQATTRDTLASGHFMSVINILMQLRKVCNHPNLFDPRPIHSPFITSAICYSVPSLVLHALQHHPLQCADMARFDLINMENRTSRYESEIFLPRYKPTHSLIQEIADSPEPPPRPRPLKMKVNRMLQPVTKPDPRTLVVVNNSRHVQKPADPPLIVVPPPVPAGPQAQAPPNPVFSGVVGSLQQTVQTQVPPVVQSAPGLVSVAPSTMGTVKPVAAPTAQPVNSTPQRLILSPDMQARLPSGEVITLSQLASLGRPLQAPAVTKPLTVQLHGAKLTLAGPQIRQLGMGQVRPLQGNVLHLVSSGGQHHLLSQPAQLALIQALTQQASSPAPSAPPSALVQNSVQAQLGVQTMSLQSVPHALLAGANLPAAAVTGQAPGVVKIVVRQAARETPVSSPRPPQTPPLHLPQNTPRPLLRVLPGSLPENGTSRTGHGERAVTAVTTSSIATSPLLMVSSPKPPAPNPIGSLQNHNVAFNTEAPSAVSGVALRLLTSGTSATLQLTNHHSSSQPRPTQSPALTSSPAHSLASTGSALGQIPGLANRPPCQGVTSDLNTCAIPQKVSATDTNLNQSEGQVSFPLSNGNGFGQTTLFLPQNSTVKDHLDSVISQTPPAPLSCLSAPVPTSEHNQLLSLNSSPASPPNATPGLPKLAPSGYNFSLVPALLTNSSPCTVSSYNPVPARFLTSPVSLLTLAPLSSTNSNTASILYTHPNTISTLGASATTSQTIPLPMVQSSATLSPQCLSQPPLPASVTLVSASISLPSTSTPPCNALSALTSSSPAGHAAAAPAASTSSIMLASASAPFSSITLATQTPVALTTPNSTAEFIAPGPVAALAAPSSGPLASITLAPASTSTALPSMAMPSAGRVVAAVDALPAASLIPLAGSPAHATRSILAAPASDSFTTLVASTSAHRPLRTAPASASLPLTVIASPTPAPVAALAALTPTGDTSLATLGAPVSAPLAVLASPAPLQTLSGSISVPFSLLAASVSETLPSLVLSTQLPLVTTSVTEPALSSSRATLLPASPLPLMTGSDNIPLLSSVTLPLLSTSVPVLAAKSTFTTSPVSQTTVTASPVSQTAITASPVSQIVVAASPVSQIVVAASPVSQTAVVASPVSQTTVVASPVSQTAVVASPVSQTAVVASPVSQTAVVATPVSQIVVAASPVSQIVVTASPVSQSAVAASPVAQSAVAASPVAQSAVAASPVAQSAVASSPVSQTVVTASPVAQSAVAASSVSQSAVATSPAAQSAAAASPVSQTIVPAYLVAQKAVAASPVAQTAVVASPAPQEVAASLPLPVPQAASTTSAPFTVSLAAAPGLASPQAATLPLALHQSVPAPLLSVPQAAAISLPAPQAVSLRGPAAMASSLLSIPPEVTAPPLTIPPAVATATPLPVPQAVAAVASQYTAQALVPALSAPPLLQSVSFHSLASSSVTASSCTTWAATLLPSPAAVSSISMHQPIHASAPPPLQASSEQISRPLLPSPSSSIRTTFAIPVTKPPISSSASCFDAPSPALQTSSSLQLSSNPAAASAPVSSLSFCIATSVSTTLSNVTAPVSESPPPLAASCAPVSAAEPTLSLSVASPSSVSVTLNTTMETDMLLDGDISRSTHSTGGSASVWPRRQLPPPPRSPFYLEPLEERRRRHKVERLERIFQLNEQRCGLIPVYGAEIIRFCSLPNKPVLLADPCSLPRHLRDYWLQTSGLTNCVFTPQQRLEQLAPLIERFIFAMPPVEAPRITLHTSHPPPSLLLQESLFKETLSRDLTPRTSCLHRIISNMRTQFPDLRLIQYDCGKLQTLDRLLRGLKSGGHRVLLFTQMTRMLDILEQFLNYHGHIYLRLDGSTRVEQRQVLMERFNMDKRIFCFILSTRSGGVGVNLTGADTVIFYDSDWNPTMDAQAQDRCHRIGQTRDVHIYRLVSDRTVEENILKKAQQKRMLGDMAIEGGNFTTAYFKQQTIRELFEMEDVLRRDTETRPASPERSTEDGSSGRHTNILEQALCGAEDEEDTLAASLVRAEQVADLAEFNENAPLEPEEEEPSRAEQEISALVEQLTPIERYAMYYLEASMEDVSREELKQAEEQVEAARKDLFLAKDDGQSAEERWEEECRKIRKSRALPPARSQGERPPVRMSERLRGGRATEGTDVGCPAVKETTAPVPQDVRLAEETHSLETETPAEETVSSGHENMSSEETGAPVQETESPAVQTDTPVTETVSPAEESVTPVQDAAGPCGETITPSPKKVQDTARSLVDQSLPPKTDLPEPDPMVKSEDDSRVLEEYSSSPPALPQQEVLELQGFLDMEECQREVLKEEEKLIVPKHETSLSSLSACAPQGEESSAPRTPRRKVTADSEILLAGAADGSPTAKVLRRLPGRLITVVQDRPPVHRRSRGRGPRPLAEHGARSPHTSEPQSPMHGLCQMRTLMLEALHQRENVEDLQRPEQSSRPLEFSMIFLKWSHHLNSQTPPQAPECQAAPAPD